ncbi:MAG: aldo/keto reductase [Chloroflexi bacterium]|nr:aldo/keto reductase [Chloroflexota bacterium]
MQLLDAMDQLARKHGKNLAQIAIAWILANPTVTSPIIGANTTTQLRDSLGAVGWRLSADDKKTLDDLTAWQVQ